jgi:hypothetical protein
MTTISETAPRNHRYSGTWSRTMHALGKLWAKVLALPDTRSDAARRKAPPSEYFIFPPF